MLQGRTVWIVIALMLLLDAYVFQVVRFLTSQSGPRTRLGVGIAYWVVALAVVFCISILPSITSNVLRSYLMAIILGLFLAKLLACLFFLADDFRRLIQWMVGKLFFHKTEGEAVAGEQVSRSAFVSWLGMAVGGTLFGTLVYGFRNKYNYHIRRVTLSYPNLPAGFEGFRFVQLSDIHSGSFNDMAAVEHGIDLILNERPDCILFTGDIVNNKAVEMEPYRHVFARLKAPMGVYSTLGNHDYGDYDWWPSAEAKQANLDRIKAIHGEMGWRLLMNEHVALRRGGDEIALIGIENWSAKARFPKYGRMDQAYPGAERYPFKILMSHDPSHWDAQVRPAYPDIDLTLSGHTHGMQFGIEIPGFKWSPVEYVYKEWAGLYEQGAQKLYVNRGFGFLGYPGRVGILPEITVFELQKSV
ncbi:MAG TPA: metallophosphoesterase [Dinghuibacter sp.]|uniref:metallophosphoesterase n=1 Tax=Dinghuibacter sp. TaxID=2024697 RepID=UPI002C7FC644|nr:metallophosphoesterase [Dinghuibacter sp.]HTJ12938.1 metallophosphoesterase [Dinghuibacter sp.]